MSGQIISKQPYISWLINLNWSITTTKPCIYYKIHYFFYCIYQIPALNRDISTHSKELGQKYVLHCRHVLECLKPSHWMRSLTKRSHKQTVYAHTHCKHKQTIAFNEQDLVQTFQTVSHCQSRWPQTFLNKLPSELCHEHVMRTFQKTQESDPPSSLSDPLLSSGCPSCELKTTVLNTSKPYHLTPWSFNSHLYCLTKMPLFWVWWSSRESGVGWKWRKGSTFLKCSRRRHFWMYQTTVTTNRKQIQLQKDAKDMKIIPSHCRDLSLLSRSLFPPTAIVRRACTGLSGGYNLNHGSLYLWFIYNTQTAMPSYQLLA